MDSFHLNFDLNNKHIGATYGNFVKTILKLGTDEKNYRLANSIRFSY